MPNPTDIDALVLYYWKQGETTRRIQNILLQHCNLYASETVIRSIIRYQQPPAATEPETHAG